MHAFFNDISELLDLVLHCFLISLSDFCTFPGGWREPFSEPFDLLDGLAHRIGWNVSGLVHRVSQKFNLKQNSLAVRHSIGELFTVLIVLSVLLAG